MLHTHEVRADHRGTAERTFRLLIGPLSNARPTEDVAAWRRGWRGSHRQTQRAAVARRGICGGDSNAWLLRSNATSEMTGATALHEVINMAQRMAAMGMTMT